MKTKEEMKEYWIAQGSFVAVALNTEEEAKGLKWAKSTIHVRQIDPAEEERIKELELQKHHVDLTVSAAEDRIKELREKFLKLYSTVEYWANAGLIEDYSEVAKSLGTSLGDVMDEASEVLVINKEEW